MTDSNNKTIYAWEPWFFMFFGVFHMHRIWALVNRKSYATFWMGIMENKGWAYFVIMGFLSLLCILGIFTFIREIKHNYWWRLIYVIGGVYLLFDLFAIISGLEFWYKLLLRMYDTDSFYWEQTWTIFIVMGGLLFILGIDLLKKRLIK